MQLVPHYRRQRGHPAIQCLSQQKPPWGELLRSEIIVNVNRPTLTVNKAVQVVEPRPRRRSVELGSIARAGVV